MFCHNLVPRVSSAFNMAAGREKTLAHSRSRDQNLSIEDGQIYANVFKTAARNKVRVQQPTKQNGVRRGDPKV